MMRTSDQRRSRRLDDAGAARLAEVMHQYGVKAAINDPDLCLHCLQHQCIAVCPTGSLSTQVEGRVRLDTATCCGCTACVLMCREFRNMRLFTASAEF